MERLEALDKAILLLGNPASGSEWKLFAEQFLIDMRMLILTDRNADYGNPDADYAKAAARSGTSPEVFVRNLIDMKLSREEHKHKRDNLLDAANYCLILAFIQDRFRMLGITDCEDKIKGDVNVGPSGDEENCPFCKGKGGFEYRDIPGGKPLAAICTNCYGTGRKKGE